MTLLTLALLLAQTSEAPAEPAVEAAAEEKPAPEVKPEPSPWTAGLTAGLTWISGNADSLSLSGGAEATRKTDKTIWATKAVAGYGEKYGALPEVLLYNAALTSQFDYRFTHWISAFVGAGIGMDHVKSIELAGYGEIGIGFIWIDTKSAFGGEKEQQKAFLKTDLSAKLLHESRFQYYPFPAQVPDTLAFGPALGVQAHYQFTATAYVHEDLQLMPSVISPQRLMLSSTSKAGVVLIAGFAATISLNFRYDSSPAPDKKPLDTILSLGVETKI